jgi:hypothetical protein
MRMPWKKQILREGYVERSMEAFNNVIFYAHVTKKQKIDGPLLPKYLKHKISCSCEIGLFSLHFDFYPDRLRHHGSLCCMNGWNTDKYIGGHMHRDLRPNQS